MSGLHLHLCVCGSDVDLAKVSDVRDLNNVQEVPDLNVNDFNLTFRLKCKVKTNHFKIKTLSRMKCFISLSVLHVMWPLIIVM